MWLDSNMDGNGLTRVDRQGGVPERLRHDDGGGFVADPGQGLEVVEGGGHLPAEPLADLGLEGGRGRSCVQWVVNALQIAELDPKSGVVSVIQYSRQNHL